MAWLQKSGSAKKLQDHVLRREFTPWEAVGRWLPLYDGMRAYPRRGSGFRQGGCTVRASSQPTKVWCKSRSLGSVEASRPPGHVAEDPILARTEPKGARLWRVLALVENLCQEFPLLPMTRSSPAITTTAIFFFFCLSMRSSAVPRRPAPESDDRVNFGSSHHLRPTPTYPRRATLGRSFQPLTAAALGLARPSRFTDAPRTPSTGLLPYVDRYTF